ncbi:laci bacterial regulatory protein hth signature [Lucifera butyrica]|uniref:Laci bacterial regulatory protein hth signature n=1 Tax=Lucifera butyrica TaxID=1351585 RepID=A0A498RG46_9FIRM|nr:LacI family DNA-binding transcriptional regulator [Lucifera butyrica]VBB09780.1 laci bacterial regulatory protein hth signature [Lucifera butyrica]
MTIYDIAKKCNVSIATVSRVLNGSRRVSPETRERVLAVMKEEDYNPNPFARGLGLDSMKMIGVLCADVADTFYAKAVSLIENDLRQKDWNVVLCCTGSDDGKGAEYLRYLTQKHVDAIIIVGTPFSSRRDVAELERISSDIPIITINSDYHSPSAFSIVCDEKEGMRTIVKKLAEKNCSSILYLYDSLTYSGKQKLAGYRAGIDDFFLDAAPVLAQKIPRTLEAAENIVRKLIANDIFFDAIVTSEDLLAVAAQRAALKNGKAIPVIGCNNSILAECSTPTLTSLDNRLGDLCTMAVHTVTQLMSDRSAPVPTKTVFSAQIAERESFVFSVNQ